MSHATARSHVTLLFVATSAFACASPPPAITPTPAASQVASSIPNEPRTSLTSTLLPAESEDVRVTPAPSASPVATGTSHMVETDDGSLTVAVPEAAVPDPAAITILARGAEDLPPELEGLEVRSAFYEVAPAGMSFAAPVTVTRRVSFTDLEVDPSDGVPILVLAIRSADGVWEWLVDQTLQRAGDHVIVSGLAAHTGTLFAFGGRASANVETIGDDPVALGNSLQLAVTLGFPDDSRDPPLLGAFEAIITGDIVQVGDAEGPANDRLSQRFVCAGAGTATVGIRYRVLNVGAETALFDQLGLAPVTTHVEATTSVVCEGSPTAAPS